MTVDMGPPELNGPKVPSTLPTNDDGIVLKEPIQVILVPCARCLHVEGTSNWRSMLLLDVKWRLARVGLTPFVVSK